MMPVRKCRMNRMYTAIQWCLMSLCCVALVACGTPPRKPALNDTSLQSATIDGLADVRFVPSTPEGIDAYLGELKRVVPLRDKQPAGTSYYLSLSGGGDNGAFGAGILTGWSKRGDRPVFDQVVGISTGSLVAPFAFLGADYDAQLETVFTTVSPGDIYKQRGLYAIISGDSLADNTPLLRLIEKHIDQVMLEQIAQAYEREGRLLLIGTTNIDTGQLVIWNMGHIAALRSEASAALFHRIMLASAAVPGMFPAALFDAEVNGQAHHELHVDGGLSVQIYLYPAAVSKKAIAQGIIKPRKREAYIIRNATISVGSENTEPSSLGVLTRSYKKIIQSQGVGNLYQIYQIAQRDKVGFNLAFIGDDFKAPHPDEFDQGYMKALFAYGYQKALHGYPWGKSPPGFDESTREDIQAQSRRN